MIWSPRPELAGEGTREKGKSKSRVMGSSSRGHIRSAGGAGAAVGSTGACEAKDAGDDAVAAERRLGHRERIAIVEDAAPEGVSTIATVATDAAIATVAAGGFAGRDRTLHDADATPAGFGEAAAAGVAAVATDATGAGVGGAVA